MLDNRVLIHQSHRYCKQLPSHINTSLNKHQLIINVEKHKTLTISMPWNPVRQNTRRFIILVITRKQVNTNGDS